MGLMTWKESDPDVSRTPLLQIRMGISGFGLIPRTLPGVLKMLKTRKRALSYASRDPGHLLSFEIEDPSLIQTYFYTHIVNGVFLRDKQQRVYEEMLRLQGLGANTLTGAPYTDDQIMALVRQGKQRGQIPDVGRVLAGRGKDVLPGVAAGVTGAGMMRRAMMRTPARMKRMKIARKCYTWVLPGQGTDVLSLPPPRCPHPVDVEKLKKSNKRLTKHVSMIMKLFRSDDKMTQILTQLESQPEFDSGSRSGGVEDDELGMMRTSARMMRMNVAWERIPFELSPTTYPGRYVSRDSYLKDKSPENPRICSGVYCSGVLR
nr:hypothetical protein [Tanacetum cinerariifolium]